MRLAADETSASDIHGRLSQLEGLDIILISVKASASAPFSDLLDEIVNKYLGGTNMSRLRTLRMDHVRVEDFALVQKLLFACPALDLLEISSTGSSGTLFLAQIGQHKLHISMLNQSFR
jgi:hypothetical protein